MTSSFRYRWPFAPSNIAGPLSEAIHPWRSFFLVAALTAFLCFFQLGRSDLVRSHEARAAQNAQRMIDDHAFVLPTLFDGQVELQKPPGYYWLAAACGELLGGTMTPFTTRLPAALAGFLTVLMVFALLKRQGRDTEAWVAALLLATAIHFTATVRTARIDAPLMAAVAFSLCAFHRSLDPVSPRRAGWLILSGLGVAAAVLLKGPIGLALAGVAGLAIFVVREHDAVRPSLGAILIAGVVFLGVTLPWFLVAEARTHGEFLNVFLWHHNVARFLGTAPTLAAHPWWYYLPRFAVDFLPWTPSFVFLIVRGFRTGLWRRDPLFRVGLVWFAAMMLVFSASRFKRADYLLPAYPGAALAMGCAAVDWWRQRTNERSRRLAMLGFAGVIAAVTVGWQVMTFAIEPRLVAEDEKRPFAEVIRTAAPRPQLVKLFRVESHLLAFHLGRPLHTLVEWGELNDRLLTPGPHYFVTQPQYVKELQDILPHHRCEVVARLEDFTTAPPPRPLVFLRKVN